MICPKCGGRGEIVVSFQRPEQWFHCYVKSRHAPCDYPGCHNGLVSCCDGLQETPKGESDGED